MKKITRALISVHDKAGIAELASFLAKKGVEILSCGVTMKMLEKSGVKVTDVTRLTGFADLLDGRVKSLQPLVFAPILVDRSNSSQMEGLKSMEAEPINLVVANFPPSPDFAGVSNAKSPEGLDISISRIALIRAAAGNFREVAVLSDKSQYEDFMEEMSKKSGRISEATRVELALQAFERSASYDIDIYKSLLDKYRKDELFHDSLFFKFEKIQDLRYGENPHQSAALYVEPGFSCVSLCESQQLTGRELSFNNVADLDAAIRVVQEFDKPAAVLVKHGSPIGVALDKDATKAYKKARDVDPASAFGGVLAFNCPIDKKTADEINKTFIEAVASPRYTDGAIQSFSSSKKNKHMRVIQIHLKKRRLMKRELDFHRIDGGVLVQDRNGHLLTRGGALKLTTKRKPTRKQLGDMVFAWKVCKYVRSNAVVLARDSQTVGTGTGQMSRIDSMRTALEKAGNRTLGAVMASDAFIPFEDVIEEAARRGIVGIIQPGGSRHDDEIIMAADEHNISMAITDMRHFKL